MVLTVFAFSLSLLSYELWLPLHPGKEKESYRLEGKQGWPCRQVKNLQQRIGLERWSKIIAQVKFHCIILTKPFG